MIKFAMQTNKPTDRQNKQNLVYWPTISCKTQSGYMKNSPVSHDKDPTCWQTHMNAVANIQDKQAFHALYLYFSPKIIAYYRHQGLNSQAEELAHEVFLRIWQKAPSYQAEKAQVSTWIFTIVRNLRIDYLRKKRINEVSDSDLVEQGEDANLNQQLDLSKNKIKLSQSFSLLSQEQRNVLQKVYFEDKSHVIAANELEMTPGVVKSRIRGALTILKSQLGGEK